MVHQILGRPVEYASIRPGRTFRGCVVPVDEELTDADAWDPWLPVISQPPAFRADVERRILATLAGPAAARSLAWHGASSGYTEEEAVIDELARDALAALGPRVAELVVKNERAETMHSDAERADEYATAFVGFELANHYLAWLRLEAEQLVRQYRAAILHVAAALERRAVLRGEEVAALVFPVKGSN